MKLFEHKYDFEVERLRLSFVLEKKCYAFFFGDYEIPYDKLNRKSKRKLDKENKTLMNNPELLNKKIEEAKIINRARYLSKIGFPCGSIECLTPTNGTMTKEMEKFINEHLSKSDVLLGGAPGRGCISR